MRTIEARAIISAKDNTGQVFESIAGKIRKLEQATRSASGGAGKALGQVAGPLAKIDHAVHKISGAVGASYAVHRTARAVENVAELYKTYDDLVRYQRAILGITEEQQKSLIKQATSGEIKGFNDIEILHAQTDLAQRGLPADAIAAITDASAKFALALGTDLPTAAKTLEGILFSTGKDLKDTSAAVEAANKAASYATKLAKISGLNEEDVRQFFKYGGAPGSVAGFSDETLGAMAAILRKSNIRGDESGVAVRAFAGKLVSPTKKGIEALGALGLNYGDYTKMPGALSAENLSGSVARNLGKKLSADQIAALKTRLEDPEVVGDQGAFTDAVVDIVGQSFAKAKNGELKAVDSKAIAKVAGGFYKLAVESVDVEKLLRDILAANPTLAQANALFTDRQGARFSILAKGGLPLFNDYVQKLLTAGGDFHSKIAEERTAGFSGAMQQAEAAVLNFTTAVGRAWDPQMTAAVSTFGGALQHLSELDPTILKIGTAATAAVAGLVAFEIAAKAGAAAMGLVRLASLGAAGAGAAAGVGAAAAGAGAVAGGAGAAAAGAAGVGAVATGGLVLGAAAAGYLGYLAYNAFGDAFKDSEPSKAAADALNSFAPPPNAPGRPALPGGGAGLTGPGLTDLGGGNYKIESEVTGRADVNVTVRVEPSALLEATMKRAEGVLRIQSAAPTGRSMPEAAPTTSTVTGP
ncbi:phage tail tape measure protein [Xanthobacter sp. ZOL 2024]